MFSGHQDTGGILSLLSDVFSSSSSSVARSCIDTSLLKSVAIISGAALACTPVCRYDGEEACPCDTCCMRVTRVRAILHVKFSKDLCIFREAVTALQAACVRVVQVPSALYCPKALVYIARDMHAREGIIVKVTQSLGTQPCRTIRRQKHSCSTTGH